MEPTTWLGVALSFLIGSIPFGFLLGRAKGVDVRNAGSGNIGATNVGRVLGKPWGYLCFAVDFLKGTAPKLLLPPLFSLLFPQSTTPPWAEVLWGLAVVLGHNYCPWLGWKGGKGIATTGGVLLTVFPPCFAWAVGSWLVLFAITRTVSIGSLAAAVALAGSGLFYYGLSLKGLTCVMLGIVAVWRHWPNIQRIIAGTEPKAFNSKKEVSTR